MIIGAGIGFVALLFIILWQAMNQADNLIMIADIHLHFLSRLIPNPCPMMKRLP